MEARSHLNVLNFFNNICNQSEDSIEKRLARRQYAVKDIKSNSWFVEVKMCGSMNLMIWKLIWIALSKSYCGKLQSIQLSIHSGKRSCKL